MKTILTPNTSPDRKRGLYLRLPVKPVPPSEQNLSSWAATWNEGRDPDTVLSVAERRARRVLEGEGIRPVKRIPKTGTVRSIPTIGTVVESKPLSERAEVAVAVLWAAFAAREAIKSRNLASAVVEAIGVGTLSERMLVLPFEAEVVRLASNRSKGAEKTREKFAEIRQDYATRVESHRPERGVSKACRDAVEEWIREKGISNPNRESLRETFRAAYRKVFPPKPRK